MTIQAVYDSAICPTKLIKLFSSHEEFYIWLLQGNKEDIKCTLKAFEAREMYEECQIIKFALDEYE